MNLRKEARERYCQIRIPGVCNHNRETTVLCHLNGGGTGMKHDDKLGAWGCSSCHDMVDGRVSWPELDDKTLRLYLYEGVFRTQQQLIKEGKL